MAGDEADQPDISAAGDQVALTWNNGDSIYFAQGEWDRIDNATRWASPVPVSTGSNAAEKSQIVTDENGKATVVWIEDASILTSGCEEGMCSEPVSLSGEGSLSCAEGDSKPENVTLAIGDDGSLLVVWQDENGALVL